MNIWQDFLTNQGRPIGKWVHYFPIYEKHFYSWRNKDVTVLEIGVAGGGSIQLWNRFFGPRARIIGIDIDPNCSQWEKMGVSIRIGNQNDEIFLDEIINEFGVPDIVIDDGSHRMEDVLKTFRIFYPLMPKNALYLVEDLHTAYWPSYGGGVNNPSSFINICKHFIDQLNADYARDVLAPDLMTRDTYCISFYDSIVVFEKGGVRWRESLVIGEGYESDI